MNSAFSVSLLLQTVPAKTKKLTIRMAHTCVGIVPTICILCVRTKGFILAARHRNTFSSMCLLLKLSLKRSTQISKAE